MIVGKAIAQDIWKSEAKYNGLRNKKKEKDLWDAYLPTEIAQRFLEWQSNLKLLEQVQVPRWINDTPACTKSLIGFSDASMMAYGCCVYLKTIDWTGDIKISLVAAKGKVVPVAGKIITKNQQNKLQPEEVKEITSPRLQLMAAVMLAELMEKVKIALNLSADTERLAFSDSQVTLA